MNAKQVRKYEGRVFDEAYKKIGNITKNFKVMDLKQLKKLQSKFMGTPLVLMS